MYIVHSHQRTVGCHLVPLKYLEGYQDFKNLFRPCSTLRLFLPTVLPDENAVIYMDSDVILLRPLEEFWGFFAEMGDKQAAAGISFVLGYNKQPQV
ncbi:Nucleotide-diphospho-sugar transferase [Trinorchestia longiramus]|nr:Nucleotide-diphospho-sugar transferase [Trinorchestia longiramus]